MTWLDDQGGCFIDEWAISNIWPPSTIEAALVFKREDRTVEGFVTPEGNLVLVIFDRDRTVMHRFVSQPITALGGLRRTIKIYWTRSVMSVVLGAQRLLSLNESPEALLLR